MTLMDKYRAMLQKYERPMFTKQIVNNSNTIANYRNMFQGFEDNDDIFNIQAKQVDMNIALSPDFLDIGSQRLLYFDGDIWFMDYNIAKNISENRYYDFIVAKQKLLEYIQNGGICLLIDNDSAEQLYNAMKRKDFKEHYCTNNEILKLENRADNGTIILCKGEKFEYVPLSDKWSSEHQVVTGDYFIGKKISVLRTSSDISDINFDNFYFNFLVQSHYVPNNENEAKSILNIIKDIFSTYSMLRRTNYFKYSFPCPTMLVDAVEYQPDTYSQNYILNHETNAKEPIETILGTIVKISAPKTIIDFLVAKKEDELSKLMHQKPMSLKTWYKKMLQTPVKDIYNYDLDFSKTILQRRNLNALTTSKSNADYHKIIDNSKEFKNAMEADRLLRPISGMWWNALPDNEKISMFSYTVGSGHVNSIIRGNDYSKYNYESINDIKNMVSALSKSALPYTITLIRGIKIDGFISLFGLPKELKEYIYDPFSFDITKLKGLVAKEPAFSSCGCTESAAFFWPEESVVFKIICPPGTQGAYMEPFSYFGANSKGHKNRFKGLNWDARQDGKSYSPRIGNEQEFLLQSGTVFKIEDIGLVDGRIMATLVVVRQDPVDIKKVIDNYIENSY